MLFGYKNKSQSELQVDLGDLQNEKENLTSFLQLHLKVSVSQVEDKLNVDSETVSLQELQHVVNKFVYHRDLNNTHWVSAEGSTVKINKLKVIEKEEKTTRKNLRIKPLHKAGDYKKTTLNSIFLYQNRTGAIFCIFRKTLFSFTWLVKTMRTVKEVMRPVVNISPSQTVLEAAKLMKSSDRGSLLIVDGKITVGIITERDLVTRVIAENLPHKTPISEVMSSPLITINAKVTLKKAAKIMGEHRIRRLPVTEIGGVTGNSNCI